MLKLRDTDVMIQRSTQIIELGLLVDKYHVENPHKKQQRLQVPPYLVSGRPPAFANLLPSFTNLKKGSCNIFCKTL